MGREREGREEGALQRAFLHDMLHVMHKVAMVFNGEINLNGLKCTQVSCVETVQSLRETVAV